MTDRVGTRIPDVNFRVYLETNPFLLGLIGEQPVPTNNIQWKDKPSSEYFSGKRVVLFAVRGIHTPTCSNQIPSFEANYDEIISNNIDEIYCITVDNQFTINHSIKTKMAGRMGHITMLEDGPSEFIPPSTIGVRVKIISDGNKDFTSAIGMLVNVNNLGYGSCSWRYAAVINDGVIEAWFEEPGLCDNPTDDLYIATKPQIILNYLTGTTT